MQKKGAIELILLVISLAGALLLKSTSSIWVFGISATVYLVSCYLLRRELQDVERLEGEITQLKTRMDSIVLSKGFGR